MAVQCNLRINMTGAVSDPELRSERYRAAVEMAVYADRHGIPSINLEEHHVTASGWLPSPLTMAAAIAVRTERIRISIMALLAPLYDPVRVAEDIAVVDLLSRGRLAVIAGMGYRELEYHIANKPFVGRGAWMDHVLETLLAAWGDAPFDYKGQTINVTPKPYTRPHPLFMVAGMSRPAARRAARFGLPFAPPKILPELDSYYYEQLSEHGQEGFVYAPSGDVSFLFVHEDPERAWDELGQYLLHEVTEYSSWGAAANTRRPLAMSADSIAAVRAEGHYEILSPQACLQRHRERPRQLFCLHPLVGGMPLEQGWECLRLYVKQVITPLLAAAE